MATTVEELQTLVDKLYEEDCDARGIRGIRPRRPYIMVRLLPRAGRCGSLYLPEKHNKPTIDAIVITTWTSYWKRFKETTTEVDGKEQVVVTDSLVVCDLKPGDHIIMPSYAGKPVPLMDDNYRLIPYDNGDPSIPSSAVATIQYEQPQVNEIIKTAAILFASHKMTLDELIQALNEKLDIVRRGQISLIESGA